jgi:PAS domain S-box-containing protein
VEWFGLPDGLVANASTAETSETLARPSMCPGCLATNRRLANSERRFRALIDALPQMVGIVKSDASLLYANKPWYAYTGYRAVTTNPSHLDLAFHPADRMAAYKSLAAIEPVPDISSDIRVRRADGIYRWHQVHFVRLNAATSGRYHPRCRSRQRLLRTNRRG